MTIAPGMPPIPVDARPRRHVHKWAVEDASGSGLPFLVCSGCSLIVVICEVCEGVGCPDCGEVGHFVAKPYLCSRLSRHPLILVERDRRTAIARYLEFFDKRPTVVREVEVVGRCVRCQAHVFAGTPLHHDRLGGLYCPKCDDPAASFTRLPW